jgi:hypothetical protein
MRFLPVCFLLAAAALLAPAAEEASVTGQWQVHVNAMGNERDYACTFTQKDKDLTGTCRTDRGTVEISGKIEQQVVTWKYRSDYDGSPLTVSFKGKLESAGKIAGSVTAEEFGVEGEFTATLSK